MMNAPETETAESLAAFFAERRIINDSVRHGAPAAPKKRFGPNGRYAVWPMHSRFDWITWFVADAEPPDSSMVRAEIIRQADSLEAALRGLIDE